MSYIVFVAPPFDEDDFDPYYRFFGTEKEARDYMKTVLKSSDNYCVVEIYEGKRIS